MCTSVKLVCLTNEGKITEMEKIAIAIIESLLAPIIKVLAPKSTEIVKNLFIKLPDSVREEIRQSFSVKKDNLAEDQRELLTHLEKQTKLQEEVAQSDLEKWFKDFNSRGKEECVHVVYWRLESLRYLGFVEKIDAGKKGWENTPRFSYKLSLGYARELGRG